MTVNDVTSEQKVIAIITIIGMFFIMNIIIDYFQTKNEKNQTFWFIRYSYYVNCIKPHYISIEEIKNQKEKPYSCETYYSDHDEYMEFYMFKTTCYIRKIMLMINYKQKKERINKFLERKSERRSKL